jgi:AcrR family transcriptional regulator
VPRPAPPPIPLPLASPAEPHERADAARNRQKVLAAAGRLFAERGVDCVSMDEVSQAAGVGKGTLFRRFGDRASLARAVLSAREADFQEQLLRGEPPLGPGAPPVERLVAFGRGMLDLLERHGDLLLAAEAGHPLGRFRTAPYAAYRLHVLVLLREAAPRLDHEYAADALLAGLAPALVRHLRDDRGLALEWVGDGFEQLVRAVLAGAGRRSPAEGPS